MLAYSSVAHAGYLLMGIVASNELGFTGIVFYITAYMFMQIGAFVIVSIFERNGNEKMSLDDYSGLYKSHPILAALMSVFMLSLAGIPPLAGFFGKYYLFAAAIKADFLWLTIIAVISSIISMYYYIGLIIQMYFKEQVYQPMESNVRIAKFTLAVTTASVIIFGIFPSLIVDLTFNFF
jgi:NADH-quinone oxidoreductase subunit N